MNFNTLEKSLDNLLATFIADMEQSLKECFAGNDISVLNKSPTHNVSKPAPSRGPGKTPQLTTTQNFRAKFWKSLHWLLYDELFETCKLSRNTLYSFLETPSKNSIPAQLEIYRLQPVFGCVEKQFVCNT